MPGRVARVSPIWKNEAAKNKAIARNEKHMLTFDFRKDGNKGRVGTS